MAGCRHHHRLKIYAPGWDVDQHPDGRITFATPTGHAYASWPYDYRTDPEPQVNPSDSSAGAGPDPPDPDPPPF